MDKNKITNYTIIKKESIDAIKVESVIDYYRVFKYILKSEEQYLQHKEHFWVLAIDDERYISCIYLVSLGSKNIAHIAIVDVFAEAFAHKSHHIIVAHNHTDMKPPKPSEFDIDFTNRILHFAKFLNIKLIDHIILSRLSLESDEEIFYSFFLENMLALLLQDTSYQIVSDVKHILEKEKQDYKDDGIKEGKKIGKAQGAKEYKNKIIIKMLDKNYTVKQISEILDINEKEIERIKNKKGK